MMSALRWVGLVGIGLWAAAVMGQIARGQTFTITTVAGVGKAGFSGGGGPATKAPLWGPCGVAVDHGGRVYIADSNNCKIRVVRADGTIDTVAGTGKRGYAGDGGPARKALIAIPDQIDIDAAGNLYIAEFRNHVIRKLTPDR